MTEQWQFNRALQASKLKGMTRAVLIHLGVLADWPAGVIPERFSPSLSKLADITGFSRRAVAEQLNIAEIEGWVVRSRPETQKALGKNERTGYRLVVPDASLLPRKAKQEKAEPSAGGALPSAPGALGSAGDALPNRTPSAGGALDLVRQVHTTISSSISSSSSPASEPVAQIAAALEIEEEEAKRIYKKILSERDVKAPSKYVASLIASGDIAQFHKPQPSQRAYAGPRCEFEPARDESTCNRCGLLKTHARHREVG